MFPGFYHGRRVPCTQKPLSRLTLTLNSFRVRSFDFSKADAMVDVAVANTMKVRGHNLAWADEPVWLANLGHHETTFSGADVQQILENHITQVITHYKNKYPGVVLPGTS
jgi:GH35 family endo-1,4-beta-xylanase